MYSESIVGAKPLSEISLARGLPLLGSVYPMVLDPARFLLEESRRLGPIFRLRVLHHRFTVLVGHEANALLSRTADKLVSAEPSWRGFCQEFGAKNVMPGVDGAPHYRVRKILQRGYSRSTITGRIPEAITLALRGLRTFAPGPVSLVSLCRKIVTEQLGVLILGEGPGAYLDDIARVVRFSLNALLTRQWPEQLLLLPQYRRARRRVLGFGRTVLEKARTSETRSEFLEDVCAAVEADPTFLSDSDQLLITLGPFIAGLDTVANTVAFALEALLRDPTAQARVEREASALLEAGAPTAQGLAMSPLLRGTTLETLRLFPVAPLIYRHVARPFSFAGYALPKGEPLLFGTTLLHLLPENFPNPRKFDIDRYRDQDDPVLYGYGLGPHTCLGSGFANVQISLLIATLLRYARFAIEPGARPPRIVRDPTPTVGLRYRVRLLAHRD